MVPCDLCGETAAKTLLETGDRRFGFDGRFQVVRCVGCGLRRTTPQPEDPSAFYPQDDYYSYLPPSPPTALGRARVRSAYGASGESFLRDKLARLGRPRLLPGCPPGPPGRILDVGCGSGDFLLGLREAGWQVEGLEMSEGAVAAAHRAGLDGVRAGDLTEKQFDEGIFDAVRFWHVLEHVRSPREQLREARRVLRSGGSLTIGVPNGGALLLRRLGDAWYYLDVPRHLWHFDRRTLSRLVEESGFRVVSAKLVSPPTALLGTVGYLSGKGERVLESRKAWYALYPLAVALDAAGVGDAIELVAEAV